MNSRSLIVCIGNELVADDGAGRAVYECLCRRSLPAHVRLVFLGLGGIDLLEELTGENRLIVVDGVQLGGPPGTVHQLGWEGLPENPARPVSGHGIGIREAIGIGKILYPERIPQEIHLIGIEGRCFNGLGAGLTAAVAGAVPEAVARVMALLQL